MIQISGIILGIAMAGMLAVPALAVDLHALDQVSVLMKKSEVLSLLGRPDYLLDAGNGLKAEVYRVETVDPMLGVGCIYRDDERLVGQAYIFRDEMGREAADRLIGHGFTVLEKKGGAFLLLGKDDDTEQPLVVHVLRTAGVTIVMTFEKSFYDRTAR